MLKPLITKHRQLLLYGFIGVTGATLDFLVFLFLYNILGLNPSIATAISVTVGIVNNFLLNAFFNFKKTDQLLNRFFTFYAVGFAGLLLSVALIYVLHDVIHIDANIAKVISIPIIVVLQYVFNKKYSFNTTATSIPRSLDNYRKVFMQHPKRNTFILVAVITFLYGLATCTTGWFADEDDNILGGILINNGQLPYLDFFSHHAPLTYFLSSIITFFTQNNLVAFRVVVSVVLFATNLLVALLLYRKISKIGAIVFLLAITLLAPGFWMHMLLAETIVAQIVTVAMLITVIPSQRPLAKTLFWLFILFVVSSLLNPIYSIIYLLLGAYVLLREKRKIKSLHNKKFIIGSSLLSLFGIGIIVALLISPFGQAFKEQYLAFNSTYYAPFSSYSNSLSSLAATPLKFISSLVSSDWRFEDIFSIKASLLIGWLLGLFFVVYKKKYGLALILFLVMSATQVRDLVYLPTYNGGAQHAMVWIYLSVAMLASALPLWYRNLKADQRLVDIKTTYVRFILFGLASVALIGLSAGTVRATYLSLKTVKNQEPNTLVYNRQVAQESERHISKLKDYETYWAGPLRFEVYFSKPNQSASKYMFYLPWHANCPKCERELLNDLQTNQPGIILWEDTSIAAIPTRQYAQPIYNFIAANYIQSKNPKLSMYYFKNADIMQRVEENL